MGQTKPGVQVSRLLLGPAGSLYALVPGAGALMLGWELLESGPRQGGVGGLPASLLRALERRSVLPGGSRSLRGGRFEVAVVGHCQPKITMGRWGGRNPGGQPLTWLAVLLVSPVL